MTSILTVGVETRVNTTIDNEQSSPVTTTMADGSYVIVWQSYAQDEYMFDWAQHYGIYSQRYNAAGNKVGVETRVNTTVLYSQDSPSVTGLTGGNYVIVWQSDLANSDDTGVFSQLYNSNGVKIGGETQVNTFTALTQGYPSVAKLTDGGYVISWSSFLQDGSSDGVYCQHYAANGAKVGGELAVNTTTAGGQYESSAIGLADGGWVVSWTSDGQDGSGRGIYAQRYSNNGAKAGTEFRVNTATEGDQTNSDMALLNDGTYVVIWNGYDASTGGVLMQRFNTAPLTFHNYGSEIVVNTTTTDVQSNASITALSDGGFVILWESLAQDGDSSGIYMQRYDALSHRIGDETLVNTTTAGGQGAPDVTALANGGFVVTWDSPTVDGGYDIMRKTYAPAVTTAGSQQLFGTAGDDVMNGGTGGDLMWGGYGNDTYTVDNFFDIVFEKANEGVDIVWSSVDHILEANVENMLLTAAVTGTGNALDNAITGNGGVNTIIGMDGNDTLDGGAGLDNLYGGTGNDTYVVDSAGDIVSEETVAGTDDGGTDTVQVGFSYALGAHIENLTLTGTGNIDGTGNALDNTLTGNSGNNSLNGGAGADTLVGGAGNDTYYVDDVTDIVVEAPGGGTDTVISSLTTYTLTSDVENLTLTSVGGFVQGYGNALDNVIIGTSGDNYLSGNGGIDTTDGGAGNDGYTVDNSSDIIIEVVGNGIDTVTAYATWNMAGADVENLSLGGSGDINAYGNALNNNLTGNSGSNTLTGGGGNDIIDGGVGVDTLLGGAGNDAFIVDNAGDLVTEYAGEGHDSVRSLISYTLTDNVEDLALWGVSSGLTATGNALDNGLISYTGGNDVLDGGLGADTMYGGAGNDTYMVDNVGDVARENLIGGVDDGGVDTVMASVSFGLESFIENIRLTGSTHINAYGNDLANGLAGNDGNNSLDGEGGADTMTGGLGNDIYYVDDVNDNVVETADQGTDTILASVDYTLSGRIVETLTLTDAANIDATGNSKDNTLNGNSGDNVLKSLGGDDVLNGGAGNDMIDGGTGVDTMSGGLGDDTFTVDNIGDIAKELTGQGSDIILSSVTFGLSGTFVETLTLTGAANINATGNSQDNTLNGNAGNNTLLGMVGTDVLNGGAGMDILDGGAGADTMSGGTGDDTFYVDNVGDVVKETAGQGNDIVYSSVTFTLAGYFVEALTLTGASTINGTGNGSDNILIGNSGINKLNGGYGHDMLTGNGGADVFVFSTASGADTITDFSAVQGDTINVNAYHAQATAIIAQVGSDATIDFGGGNIVTVANTIATDATFLSHIVW